MFDSDHAPTLQPMFYTSNVNAACRDIDGGRVLLEHLSSYVQSQIRTVTVRLWRTSRRLAMGVLPSASLAPTASGG